MCNNTYNICVHFRIDLNFVTICIGGFQDSDVHITFEDQQKINKFARLNARVEEYREELKTKQVTVFKKH